jgi:hypothetical protein
MADERLAFSSCRVVVKAVLRLGRDTSCQNSLHFSHPDLSGMSPE